MGYRKFTKFIALVLAVFATINAFIWFMWVKDITSHSRKGGDLVRMGYISGLTSSHILSDDLPIRHMDIRKYDKKPVDIITVGDSFSVGGGGGHNSYYQDYIASVNNIRVLNVPSYFHFGKELQFQPVITLSKLINSGYLDIIKPKYLLLESIERMAITRFTTDFTLEKRASIEEIDRYFMESSFELPNKDMELQFVNNGNWKFLANAFQYSFRDRARGSSVLKTHLTKPLFTSNDPECLLFYCDDLNTKDQATVENVRLLNSNLNKVAKLLQSKGIILVFMPVVDKLNLYHPYLKSNKYPQSTFFEKLRTLPKDYIFIDTKAILSSLLEKGEKDVFFQDDTHWNWKASKAIFEKVLFTKRSE
ncbi:MAG: hypothetical protein PHN84_04285 [Desulfuromonadaceae bacterium]|nr:hypothetical protein [Desulfuromonadaceae bacterium]MDD2856284.1 hypothetical protein [Desulfuromonadaceae bacterium]